MLTSMENSRTIYQPIIRGQKRCQNDWKIDFLTLTAIIACVVACVISPCNGFFFPKSFFRKGTSEDSPPPLPQQHPRVLPTRGHHGNSYGTDTLQGSATDIQPALRIANRPPASRNINGQGRDTNGPVPGTGFHVPKELCLACERFPWMPVTGGERAHAASSNAGVLHSNQQFLPGAQQNVAPTKTIVINALGEAQGPVPIPPSLPSRRPFAIQFDANESENKVNNVGYPKQQNQPSQPPATYPSNQNDQIQGKPDRPVSFQIFQAQTLQQQALSQMEQSSVPLGMQPPPPPSGNQVYGAPTILQPAPSSTVTQTSKPNNSPSNHQSNYPPPPPNPLAVGSIVATQQNLVLPEFQKIEPAKLVYQEHFTSQSSSPVPQSPQNFKVPIISQSPPLNSQSPKPDGGYNTNGVTTPQIPPQHNFAPPPQTQSYRPTPGIFLQMRPPAPYRLQPPPSPNMKPPGLMVHYGKPIRIPSNIGPQRPSGQVHFPPPQAFLQMAPPLPAPQQNQLPNKVYGSPLIENNVLGTGNRPQDERRPAPSGQVLNILEPQNLPVKLQGVNVNSIQPVPIPVPTLQSSNSQQGGKNQPGSATFTQETGWEIIPSIQTDLTHLFTPEHGKQQSRPGNELPIPVPIPVPQTHAPKKPVFIVAGDNQQLSQQQHTQIKVQDVTYHEEDRNAVPSDSKLQSTERPVVSHEKFEQNTLQSHPSPSNENQQILRPENHPFMQQQNQHIIFQQQQHQQIPQQVPISQPQIIRPRPFILGVPTGPSRPIIFRPRPQQNYEPLHPSIMTALNHAQKTSYLTHQYLSQANVGPENSIYVNQVSPTLLNLQSRPVTNEVADVEDGNEDEKQENAAISPRIPVGQPTVLIDQSNVNCQNTHQNLVQITTHQKQQQQLQENSIDNDKNNNNEQSEPESTSLHQSISSSDSPSENDDQSFSSGSGRDTLSDNDASPAAESTLDSLSQEPTAKTSLQSPPASFGTASTHGIRGSINVEDNGSKGSYMLYYSRPLSKAPVYWVQPSRTLSQGVVRLSPQISPISPPVASSVVTWSRPRVVVANQFRLEPQQELNSHHQQEGRAEQQSYEGDESGENENVEHSESGQASSDVDTNEEIPYGQKLGVTRDYSNGQTPYDIISVTGSDDDAQSLESSGSGDNSQRLESAELVEKEHLTGPDFTSTGNDGLSSENKDSTQENIEVPNETGSYGEYLRSEDNKEVENENKLHETKPTIQDNPEDADDERDDFGFRSQTIFRKPISTTVIHSPGASSFQSTKFPNFKPHRVIVHDFTTHSANAAATGPSASASDSQGNLESSESQEAPASESIPDSWKASHKLKAPKLVENDGRDEASSESIHQPQGFNIQKVIASGPVSTADCLTTAHNGHLLSSHTSTSPRTAESSRLSSGKGRDIFLPIGSRFPGGRPSIFSAIRRPISVTSVIDTTSSTSTPSTYFSSSEREPETLFQPNDKKRDRYFVQSPSGFAASIPVPVYRRPAINHGARDSLNLEEGSGIVTPRYVRPQTNIILSAEDIYKGSEGKESNKIEDGSDSVKLAGESSTSTPTSIFSTESETMDSVDEIMSTEKSSSFSVSVVDDKGSSLGSLGNEDERSGSVKTNDLQQVDEKFSKVNIVTSIPVVSDVEPITTTIASSPTSSEGIVTSTTAIPSPASTSTKIVKTVRVRQRMRSGSFSGPLRTRFHGSGRVRVVHRPANQEYIRHFPEFSTQEGDKLAKEEEQEVKNALIELKKSPEFVKTH